MDGQRHGAQTGPGEHHYRLVGFHSADFGEEFGLAWMLEADGRQLRLGNRRGDDR